MRNISARLLRTTENTALGYTPEPETARLTFNGITNNFTAQDITTTGEGRVFVRDGIRLGVGPVLASGNQVTQASLNSPPEAFIDGTQVGSTTRIFWGFFGNVSVDQTEIDSPIRFRSSPSLISRNLVSIPDAIISFQTRGGNSFGRSVTGFFRLEQSVNNAVENLGEIRLLGTLNPRTNLFEGTLVDPANSNVEIGTFTGALYGPERERMGLAFQFTRTQEMGRIYAGTMFAPRAQSVIVPT